MYVAIFKNSWLSLLFSLFSKHNSSKNVPLMGQADTFNSPTLFLRKNRYLPGEHPEVRARCQIRAAI